MAGGKGKDKDNDQTVSMAQVHELLEQQKVFYKELLQQQESSFRACVNAIMDTANKRIDDLLRDLMEVRTSLQFTQKEVDDLKMTNKGLQSSMKGQETDIVKLAESMLTLDTKTDFLDNHARRTNIIIDGMPEVEKENNSHSEEKVLELIKNKLKLDPEGLGIESVMRIGKVNKSKDGTPLRPRPIVVKFNKLKDRDTVLRNAKKLKGTKIYINEDYPEAVRQKRKELLPKMREARQRGDIAFLRYDKLVIRAAEDSIPNEEQ